MRSPYPYELYLMDERSRHWEKLPKGEDFPRWLELEHETFYWMVDLSRKMHRVLSDSIVSKALLKRIGQIATIRFLRYRDISPVLKDAIIEISTEFKSLSTDLEKPEMWFKENLLSKLGNERWRRATDIVAECLYVQPDPDWRITWEREC